MWADLLASRTDQQTPAPTGAGGLGGSSVINGQIAIRPPLAEFDERADAVLAGWSANEVLPYFCRSEDDEQFGREPHHGTSGPIPVNRPLPARWGAVDAALCAAALAGGHPWAEDVNAPARSGSPPIRSTPGTGGG